MASSPDVVKRVKRCKLQLTDTAESATVVKILQKLKGLDITLDILAETGIGKTVNSLRRHEQAGELAKSLVRGWKRLVPKESTSHTEDADRSESLSVKDKLDDQNCPTNEQLITEDSNNNWVTSHSKSPDSSDEAILQTRRKKADSEEQSEEQKSHKDQNENPSQSSQQVLKKDLEIQEDQGDTSVISKRKKGDESNRKSGDTDALLRNKSLEDTHQKSSSHGGRSESERESKKKPKELFSFEPSDKHSETLKRESIQDDRASEASGGSEAPNKKRKKTSKERHSAQESEKKKHSKNKKAKIKVKDEQSGPEETSLSFESYLNYDANVCKRKERSQVKKHPKTTKTVVKQEVTKGPCTKPFGSPLMSINATSPTQTFKQSVMELIPFTIPLPAILPDCEKQFSVEYAERKVEKETDFCDVSEESGIFTGQRLNKKMQVYSGAKTVFLPVMMSLHQQCIRTLQNNINLLYETGGVPFEILEPVLERCTPEQLLRIEECNPVYIGETDHLWGKHCQRDFKHSKLEEYESWKEMYVRLSEERERKLKRLTKSIVSAHSSKPKGRQVKMAFIHTVAKPPRDVRIQQEIHGTAVQQPQLKCSVKVQDSQSGPSCSEPSRPSSTSSGATNTQDPRKKTRVAPMMAKSLKAFKKQLGRR